MDTNGSPEGITCSQCGGELHPDEGQIFLTCPYCSAAIYLDKSKVVFHWYVSPTLNEEKARNSLMGWMSGNQTVKDLDHKAQLVGSTFEYFPMWYFKLRLPDKGEQIRLLPAAAISITEIEKINLPAGDLRKYESSLDSQAHPPTVPLQTAMAWIADEKISVEHIVEQSLVHIPLFTFKYSYQGKIFTALVEAATGEVFAILFPAKFETPYRAMGLITALIFLCLGIVPLVGAVTNSTAGTGIGLAICVGLGVLFIPILFFVAVWIASRV